MSWREHDEPKPGEELQRVYRENGTWIERTVGWLLTYPVRTLVVTFILVLVLTLLCGL